MKFVTDKQTLDDLNLLGKYKNNSIFNLFNRTVTRGGENLLGRMFSNPLTSAADINARRDIFEFFQNREISFPVSREEFEKAEHYLTNSHKSNYLIYLFSNGRRKFMKLLANEKEFDLMGEGMESALMLFRRFGELFDLLAEEDSAYRDRALKARSTLKGKLLSRIPAPGEIADKGFMKFVSCDFLLRSSAASSILGLMEMIYELDVVISVASVGRSRGFRFAKAEERGLNIDIKGVYHPCIPNAVANDICLDEEKNVLFLTGANMAGKSTLMKSFGISLYLAHMGFPVAVESMKFAVQEGIYTSINVPDNLNMGYSHFYAEVMRVKHIANEVSSGKRLTIMFDELFKGTNVKDAYDATVAVTDAFANHRESAFIVSTHIMEAGLTLKESCNNIRFRYLPTRLEGSKPVYTYILEDGISDDRHGMRIINNEKIIETIKGAL